MGFPKRIKFRGKTLVVIYGKCKGRDSYRVAWHVAGQRRMASFPSYSLAKGHADTLVKDLAKGSQITALQPAQARDALAALERLREHYQSTGRRVSLLAGISAFCEADARLNGQPFNQAVQGYLQRVATFKHKDLSEAVEEFLQPRAPRTKPADAIRPQISSDYTYLLGVRLRRLAGAFPNTNVCNLRKEHLDAFMGTLDRVKSKSDKRGIVTSAKTRNHYRTAISQFLRWCVRRGYLSPMHHLFEADGLRFEQVNIGKITFYTPRELMALLTHANQSMRPAVALCGLAGLRTAEMLRLDWQDVWRVPGHIEISAVISKTNSRRLVEICPALQEWLKPYRKFTVGRVWSRTRAGFQIAFRDLCEHAGIQRKANGLRHAFCINYFALHASENLTAQQAGNSPALIQGYYKRLATKEEAEKWFNVLPPDAIRQDSSREADPHAPAQ